MKIQPKDKRALLAAALGKTGCDLAVKNAQYVNLFTGEIYPATVFVHQGFVVHVENKNLEEGLEKATRIVDEDNKDTLNRNAKAAAISIFEGTKQRFFAQLLLSMKLPSLFPAIEEALSAELQIKGWGRKKKEAMIRGDWAEVSKLAVAYANRKPEDPV